MIAFLLGPSGVCSCLLVNSLTAADTQRRPNVVILLADDLGWKDLGCYGGPVDTPTLDRLAAEGMRFTNFYSGAAVCSPSRAVLLTGRANLRTGIYSWINDHEQRIHLPKAEVTLAELLQRNGYATAHFGKWHLGMPTSKFPDKPTPSDHGFDHWFATDNNAQPSHRNPRNFVRNGKRVGQLDGYACDLVVDEAIRWLEGRKQTDVPFFLNLWFHEPHAPLAAPNALVRQYGDVSDPAAVYSATIANTDHAIERMIDKLHEVDIPENTIIIYASDNGSYRSERVGELRGTKGSNYDGGIRVPGIFVWPHHISAGVTSSKPAGLVDLLPTVCGLVEIEPPPVHLDGADLSRLLLGKVDWMKRQQPLFWALPLAGPATALRDGRYSMVAYRDGDVPRDQLAIAAVKRSIETTLRNKGIFERELRGSTFGQQLFEGFSDPDAEKLRGEFIRLNQFHESWIPGLKQMRLSRFELYDLESDPAQKINLAVREPVVHAKMKSQLLKLTKSVFDDAFDWSSGQPAPSREPTSHVHQLASAHRSPFDAFVYMNRIPLEPEALEDQVGLASRIESRLANQEGRVQIKLPPTMDREAYEGFKLAAGIAISNHESGTEGGSSGGTKSPYQREADNAFGDINCFACHHLPTMGQMHRDRTVPTLRNRSLTLNQFRESLSSGAHKKLAIDERHTAKLLAFLQSLKDVPNAEFRPLILNATVLDTTGDIE